MSSTTAVASSKAMREVVVVAGLQRRQRRIVGAGEPRQHRLAEAWPTCRCGRRSQESPGRLDSPCGVCTLMPEQQPQVQFDRFQLQLIGSSLSALHRQRQLAVVGKAGIVVEARHLERAERDLARGR